MFSRRIRLCLKTRQKRNWKREICSWKCCPRKLAKNSPIALLSCTRQRPFTKLLDSFLVQIFQLRHDACSSYLHRLAPTLENWSHVLTIHTKVQCWFTILGTINRPTKKFQSSLLTTWNPPSHLHFPNSLELWKKVFSFFLILCCYKQVINIHQNQNKPSFGRQSKQGTFKSVFSS